jgi:hypothetical protein
MNPCTTELETFAATFYGNDAFLDIYPSQSNDVFLVALNDDNGTLIDELEFDNEDTARRYIDWLVDNAHEVQAIYARTFTL